jgi:hypothetical protein
LMRHRSHLPHQQGVRLQEQRWPVNAWLHAIDEIRLVNERNTCL